MITGVYAITNLVNGNQYIGSAKNIAKRWRVHICMLNSGTHANRHLQGAWNLYGNFEFTIIEECDKNVLLEREQYYMDSVQHEYNVRAIATSNEGMKFSAEARAKMSVAQKRYWASPGVRAKMSVTHMGNANALGHKHAPETRVRMSATAMGHTVSLEARAKISTALMGNTHALGYKHTPEERAKMSIAQTGNAKALGRKRSPETRAKMSIAQKQRWAKASVAVTEIYACSIKKRM
jgi:group I intron endonuclease